MKDGHPHDSTLGSMDGRLDALSVGVSLQDKVQATTAVRALDTEGPRYSDEGEELGRGGIGRVFSTFDAHLGREVAMKVLLAEGLGSSQGTLSSVERRFVHEARITGQLEHPAIVPVHEMGVREDGSLYYTMKRVRGRTLAEAIREAGTLDRRLALIGHVLDVCQALAYAHSRGVVHRDLKPSNVMVGSFGDTVVLDWGLAKFVGEPDPTDDLLARELATLDAVKRGQTVVGTALGTPAYMSPEQARGEVARIDTRSDVWGLGAVLYEVLTGHPPHEGDPRSTLDRASAGVVQPAMEREPAVPPDLAAVVDKALAPAPEDRYADATGLAADLEAFVQGRRVRAFRYSTFDLARRLVARNKALSSVITAALVGAVFGGVALFDAWRVAEARAVEAAASEQATHATLSIAYAERAAQLLDEAAAEEAAVFAAAAMVHSPFAPGAPWYDPTQQDPDALARLRGLVADARDLRRVEFVGSFGPAGRQIREVTTSLDGKYASIQRGGGNIDLMDLESGTLARRIVSQAQADHAMAWLETGELVIPSVDGREIQRVRPDGTVVSSFPHELRERGLRMVSDLAATPDGSLIAVQASGWILVFDGDSGALVARYGSNDMPGQPVLSPDGTRLLMPGTQRSAALFETRTGRVIRAWEDHSIPSDGVFVGGRLLLATPRGVRAIDPEDGAELPGGTPLPTASISASADGSTVLVQEPRGPVLLRADTLETLAVLPRPANGRPMFAELAGDRNLLFAEADPGGLVRIYRRAETPPARFAPGVLPVSLRADPEGTTVGLGDPSTALVLDAQTTEVKARIDGVTGPYVLPGGRVIAVSDSVLTLELFDVEHLTPGAVPSRPRPGEVIFHRRPGAGPPGGQSAVSVDGVVAFSRNPGPVVLRAGATGETLATLPHSETTAQVAFGPDGQRVAVCAQSEVVVRPVSGAAESGEGTERWSLPAACASVAWSPDGSELVAADASGAVRTLEPGGVVSDARSFTPPLTLSWAREGVIVEEGARVHLLDATGTKVRTTRRREIGAPHTLVRSGEASSVWFGEGRFVRRMDLSVPDISEPEALLAAAEGSAGLELDGFQLVQRRPDPPPPPDDPRSVYGVAATTDRGHLVHGTARLLDRDTLDPITEPVPVRHDGSFILVPPVGVDGEVGLLVEAEGFMPILTLASYQRAGGRTVSLMLTRGGHDLVYAMTGHERTPGTSGIALFAQHTEGTTPPRPIGCATLSSEPPLPFVYTAGNGDSGLSNRPSTHPVDGQGTTFNVPPVPHRFTFSVGEASASIDIPALPADHVAMAFVPFVGPDPTPPGCH